MPKRILANLHHCLTGTPAVLQALVGSLPADSDFWDLRPDADRFSPREVLAHLADWNEIFEARVSKTLSEDHPTLVGFDEEQLAIDHGYSSQDALAALSRYRMSREGFVRKVAAFADEDWAKAAHREDMGDVSVADQIVLVAIHDAYHGRQIAEYLETWRTGEES